MSVALVTGGSRGIGRAVVESLVADGWTVAFTYRTDPSPARDIEAASAGLAHGFEFDVRDRERAGQLVADVEKTIGPIDALVNNAALSLRSHLADNDAAFFARLVAAKGLQHGLPGFNQVGSLHQGGFLDIAQRHAHGDLTLPRLYESFARATNNYSE